jgi:hypothetical protein
MGGDEVSEPNATARLTSYARSVVAAKGEAAREFDSLFGEGQWHFVDVSADALMTNAGEVGQWVWHMEAEQTSTEPIVFRGPDEDCPHCRFNLEHEHRPWPSKTLESKS